MERIFWSTSNRALMTHAEWLPGMQYHLCSTYIQKIVRAAACPVSTGKAPMAQARNLGFNTRFSSCFCIKVELTLCKQPEAQTAGRREGVCSAHEQDNNWLHQFGEVWCPVKVWKGYCSLIWLKSWLNIWTSKGPSRVNNTP